jgi:hypothetical protein
VSSCAPKIHAFASALLASGAAGLGRAQVKLIAFTAVLVLSLVFLGVSALIGRIRASRRPPPGRPGGRSDEKSG